MAIVNGEYSFLNLPANNKRQQQTFQSGTTVEAPEAKCQAAS